MGVSGSSVTGKLNKSGELEVYTNESYKTHTEVYAGAEAGTVISVVYYEE